MRHVLLALTAISATAAPALAGPAVVATPAGPWEPSTESGVCRLQRSFEADGQKHLLILEQSGPGREVGIAMAGPSLAALSPDAPLRVNFAADHAGFDKRARIEPNREFGHVAILQGVWLDSRKPDADGNRSRVDPGAAQAVERIAVSQGNGSVAFATGSLGEAAEALNDCTAKVLRSWGLDPAEQYGVAQPSAPVEPEKLVKEMRKAYPTGAARGLRSGPLEVAALVDKQGAVTGCKIIVASPWSDLDTAACTAIAKARFTAARGADGQPVASYWKTRVNFAATQYEADRIRP